MKVQNLAIIFLVIIIPLVLILSYYLNLQQDTLELQAEYDTKLAEATKEGIKAFEVNTVDWTNEKQNDRTNTIAMINAFITSLSNNLNISGTAKEFMTNYIPAIAATMYDGYYIYAPANVPVNKENHDGVQLFDDGTNTHTAVETDEEGKHLMLYEAKEGAGETYTYKFVNEDNVEITETLTNLTTDITKAKREYKHNLNSKISYSSVYRKTSGLNVVVNYTLDNRIYVYGKSGTETIDEDGYLVYFDTETVLPRITINTATPSDNRKESDITVKESIANTVYSKKVSDTITNKTEIQTEVLTEQIVYKDEISGQYRLGTFKYIYDIENQKLYYDEAEGDDGNFFILKTDKTRSYLKNGLNIKLGDSECKYKSVSVLVGDGETTQYKKIYQVLNGKDRGKWYINIKDDSDEARNGGMEEVDTEITLVNLAKLGLYDTANFAAIYKDYSAISYYVEAYAFTNWVKQNLGGQIESQRITYNETTNQYENKTITLNGLFNISQNNDPEKELSQLVQHKKEVMRDNINMNLNLSISNYNRNGEYDFKLPVLADSEWQQAFSNISLITFFQGVPIGLKYYNNYAIATSTTNREYVDPGEIYLRGDDINYHRVYCEKCKNVIYTGYRSVEYVLKEHIDGTNSIYYYEHDNITSADQNAETACYYCVVNKANYTAITDGMTDAAERTYKQAKSYNEALARERYYQYEKLRGKVGITITYDSNMVEGGRITDVIDVNLAAAGQPATNIQEAAPGETITITDKIPTITTSDGVKFVFQGWSLNKDATTPTWKALDQTIFTQDTVLYAIWTLKLDSLQWHKDYSWNKGESNSAPNPAGAGNISVIRINGNNVEMYGNGTNPGKGAAWLDWTYHDINIVEMTFEYDIDFGDSFNAAGILFNISDTNPSNDHDGELSGYMISFNETSAWGNSNNDGQKFRSAGTSTLWKFTYKKGANTDNMESLEQIRQLNIPKTGSMSIEISDTKYVIDVNSGQYIETVDVGSAVSVDKNAIGFFSDHYKHSCSQCGYFKIDNINIIIKQGS